MGRWVKIVTKIRGGMETLSDKEGKYGVKYKSEGRDSG